MRHGFHRMLEGQHGRVHRARGAGPGGRLAGRDAADVLQQGQRQGDRQRQALHAARGGRPRHLHPGGLLQLPLADGPAVPLRDRTLRRVRQGRRVRLRPSLPVGLEAHRPGPAARWREVSVALARAPHGPSRVDDAGLDHAALSAPAGEPVRHQLDRRQAARAAPGRRALQRRRDRHRAGLDGGAGPGDCRGSRSATGPDGPGRQGNHRADGVPAAARDRHPLEASAAAGGRPRGWRPTR